ncbi:MAG TPA: serine/threonine-protein kinase [Thermoanaerobaculia bacterium]
MASDSMRAVGSSGLGPGTVLDGKYEILTRIGAGGMGEVFKARHLHLDAFRCIKVMKQELLADSVFRARFLREARLATQIHHPNIAAVHDFFVGDSGNYMVVEFIDGRTLRQWSAAHGPFPLALAADVASQVLAGLDHIHRRGLLHRDVSPDNVMLSFDADDRCVAKIIDLGIAKDVTNSSVSADTTQAGVLIGNPKYMSPEQLGLLGDGEQIDGRADLYCLGVVLYEMLLGVPPFASETPHGYIMKHLTQAPRRFADVRPQLAVPESIENVIFRALEKDRAKRWSSARELLTALAPFLEAPPGTLTRDDVDRLRGARALPPHERDAPTVADVPLPPADDDAFQRAWEDGRSSAWREFLERYPDSPRAEEARRLVEEATAFEAATAAEAETAVRQFLAAWPDTRHHLEAGILLAKLKQRTAERAKEPGDWETAWESGTSAGWDRYLADHPDSPRIADARSCRQETLDFELATQLNTPAMWRAFIKTWPGGRHRIEAEIRMGR